MDYSNKILQRDYLNKMDQIYHRQSLKSKQYQLLQSLLLANPIIELYDFPELFSSEDEYEQYFSEKNYEEQKEDEKDTTKLEQYLYLMLFSQAGKYPLRTKITPQFEENLQYNQMRHDLAEHQAKLYTNFLEKQRQSWTNTYSQEYNTQTIQQQLKTQTKQLQNLVEHQLRQRDNGLRYATEANSSENKYKHWIWVPNPHTRHTHMANKVVPIDEDFHVISDQAKCPDCYMRFPLDPLGPVCQIAHCKCFPVYTKTRDAL